VVIENLHAHVLLKFLDGDFARKAVIGAIIGRRGPIGARRNLIAMSC